MGPPQGPLLHLGLGRGHTEWASGLLSIQGSQSAHCLPFVPSWPEGIIWQECEVLSVSLQGPLCSQGHSCELETSGDSLAPVPSEGMEATPESEVARTHCPGRTCRLVLGPHSPQVTWAPQVAPCPELGRGAAVQGLSCGGQRLQV